MRKPQGQAPGVQLHRIVEQKAGLRNRRTLYKFSPALTLPFLGDQRAMQSSVISERQKRNFLFNILFVLYLL